MELQPWKLDLRRWQARDATLMTDADAHDWTQHATPGAGKTIFAGYIAHVLLRTGRIDRVVVVAPTDHLREQWVVALAKVGLQLDPKVRGDMPVERGDFVGAVTTYAMLAQPGAAANFAGQIARSSTLLIVDECHHAATEKPYGDALNLVASPAAYRLLLTGTPFRTNHRERIASAWFDATGAIICDGSYTYRDALADQVVRGVEFYTYDGRVRWVEAGKNGSIARDELLTDLTNIDDQATALRSVIAPNEWAYGFLQTAAKHLEEQRQEDPTAGGLVIASRKDHADQFARFLTEITGHPAVVVHEDTPRPRDAIEAFANSRSPWLVAVAMVSEGTDIERLTTLAYLTNKVTPLHFRQAVGRVVRRRTPEPTLTATVFIPHDDRLIALAEQIAVEVAQVLDTHESIERTGGDTDDRGAPLIGLATDPSFDQAITFDGAYAAAEMEIAERWCQTNSMPVQHAPKIVPLLRAQGAFLGSTAPAPAAQSVHRTIEERRAFRQTMVGRLHYGSNVAWKDINNLLAARTGAYIKTATLAQIEQQITLLQEWLLDGYPG